MTWRDIKPGMTVYHKLMVSWGAGIVEKIVLADPLCAMFERGTPRRVRVKFESHDNTTDVHLRVLRRTPDKKRIAMLEEMREKGLIRRPMPARGLES